MFLTRLKADGRPQLFIQMATVRKPIAIICGIVLLLALIGYFALSRTIDHFLKEGALDRVIGKKTAVILGADTGYLPLSWTGLSIRSDGLLVRGKPRGL